MGYAEREPSNLLSAHVRCVWTYAAPASADALQRIVPDGCPELIVHHGAPYAELDDAGAETLQPSVLFAGQLTRPLRLRPTGASAVIGVRFRPHGARAFIGVPMRETTDARRAFAADLARRVGSAGGEDARIEQVERFVAERIAALAEPGDALVRRVVERIDAAGGQVEMRLVLEDAGIGRRQLERRFADAVGVGPAMLAAIVRFRRVFDVIERDSARPWTEAALEAGYYDQSHFIREFRRFVGCTPTQFEAERTGLASALVRA
jgi:AraC-like DNA-binding protein